MELCKKYKKTDCPYFEPGCRNAESEELNCVCAKFLAFIDSKDPSIVKRELDKMNVTATEKMDIMLSMQKIFAGRFHKIENLTKDEMDHWTNAYLICIEDEIVEAMEFLNIYPTIIKDFDLKEFRKELIDILHFLMDGMLVVDMDFSKLKQNYESIFNVELKRDNFLEGTIENEKTYVEQICDENQYLYLLNYILRDIRLVRQCISWKHWKKPNESIDMNKIHLAYTNMYRHLMQIFIASGMTADDIYNVYVSKNIENVLRQAWGY